MHPLMHEIGHLLGYEHSDAPEGLMAPVLSPSPRQAFFPVPHSSSRADDVFAELGDDDTSTLIASQDGGLLAATAIRPSDEATEVKVPRRSRLQRYERDLDAWFADIAAEESGQ